jgi:hypothetical protein
MLSDSAAAQNGSYSGSDALLDVVQVDHGDALQARAIRGAEIGQPVVVGAKDRRHQRSIRDAEIEESLRGVEHLARDPVEPHVRQMLLGVVPSARHVLEAPLARDGLGCVEPRAGVRDEPDARENLVCLDHDLVRPVDPLNPGRPIPEGRVDAARPQVGRLEDVGVGREDHGRDHRATLLDAKMF